MTPDDYLRRLEKGLKALPKGERVRIVDEMRSHLAERGGVAVEALGPPDVLAASFLDDYQSARGKAVGAGAMARNLAVVGRILLLIVLWPTAFAFMLIALAGGYVFLAQLFEPALGHVVAFTDPKVEGKSVTFNITSETPAIPPGVIDVAPWKIELIAFAVFAIALTLGVWLIRFTIRRFIVRPAFDAARAKRMEAIHAG
jgi:uncharacterized membrane protein